jgi:hypothetical protein
VTVLTRTDGLTALGEAHQASARWGDAGYWLWLGALVRLTVVSGAGSIGFDLVDSLGGQYTETPADRWVLPVYNGDPPDRPVGVRRSREGLLYQRDRLNHELVSRALLRPAVRGSGILRDTHRAVHAALTGEDGTAHGAPGCQFCR